MPTFEELVLTKTELMDKMDEDLIQLAETLEPLIYQRLVKWLTSLPSVQGQLNAATPDINRYLGEMMRAIDEALAAGGWGEGIAAYLQDFSRIDQLNASIHATGSQVQISALKNVLGDVKVNTVNAVTDNLAGLGLDNNVKRPLRQAMYKYLATGGKISDVKEFINVYLRGQNLSTGALKRQAAVAARDGVMQYDGTINQIIEAEFDMNAYIYSGSIIKDSRPQCRKWIRYKYIPKSLINAVVRPYDNGKTGLIAGTNSTNFAINRGGYNCRHTATPLRLSEAELEDAKQKILGGLVVN
jgi:hypothetical protein